MEFSSRTAAITLIGVLGTELLCYLLRKWLESRKQEADRPEHQVLFFPDSVPACVDAATDRFGCLDRTCKFSHDGSDNSLHELLLAINSAQLSLDICVFTFTSRELAKVIINLSQRGLAVRVISDKEQADVAGSQIGNLRAAGIQVRCHKTGYFMHHKFAIVDKALLINGSFNWTRQAVTGNHENILITRCSGIVRPYCQEFEKLWLQFSPQPAKE